jgi:YihY family inner membrane protein
LKVHFSPRRGLALTALIVRESWTSLQRNHSLETAATLAYYGFLALIPLLLLVICLVSRFVVSSHAALDAVKMLVERLFPAVGPSLMEELQALAQQRAWPVVSLLVLFWSVTPLAATLRAAFARTFAPRRPLPFWRAKLRDLAGALALLALVLVIVAGRLIYGAIANRLANGVPWAMDVLHLTGSAVAAVACLAVFFAVFVPVRLSARELLGGSVTAAALLFLLRPAFGVFLRFNPHYGFAFGSLKAVFLIFVWIYLCFAAILLTAEIMANVRRRDTAFLRLFFEGAAGATNASAGALTHKFERTFGEGERIFEEGEPGRAMYFIQSGAVRLERAGKPWLTLRAGDFFGEMSMLIDVPRTAAAVAIAPHTRLIEVSRQNFEQILQEYPAVAMKILRELAARLKATDERLTGLPSGRPPDPSAPT